MTDTASTPLASLARVPVWVLTGFLGSGKTTFLNKMLGDATMRDTLVLVNEFGDVAIDHNLIAESTENVVLLESGCLCCAIRGDLIDALRNLVIRRIRNEVPPFSRVIVETTGLADPVPIVHTLAADLNLSERYRIEGVVTVVDHQRIEPYLADYIEARRQLMVADSIVVSKTDLPGYDVARLEAVVRPFNAQAPMVPSDSLPACVQLFESLERRISGRGFISRQLNKAPGRSESADCALSPMGLGTHTRDLTSLSLSCEQPLAWDSLMEWLGDLLTEYGPRLLRVKGLVDVQGQALPIVLQGVQHVFYPVETIPAWPDGVCRTQIVLIGQALDDAKIRASFAALSARQYA